ncbi:MAG: glycosyltransferase family 2 protein [Phycisphaerales bacterium]
MADADGPTGLLDLSVVAPAHNEQDNVAALASQVYGALSGVRGLRFELVIVDDGSTDRTRQAVAGLMRDRPWLRCICMAQTPPGRGSGQSAAFHAGVRAARGRLVATMDADLQNDPADLPAMLELMRTGGADMVQGDRSHARRDNLVRKLGSAVGRWARGLILGDSVRDTGCSLRVMRREVALALPLEFRGMHRFIPISAIRLGFRVVEMPVRHRPRVAGVTKYGFGIAQRAIPGLVDCFAVRWMASRRRPTAAGEVQAPPGTAQPDAPAVTYTEVKPLAAGTAGAHG